MKNRIKGLFLAVALTFAFAFNAMADKEVRIRVNQLPVAAQKVLMANFAGRQIAKVEREVENTRKGYEVTFVNGNKIEFNGRGRWMEMDCKNGGVPASLVPHFIRQSVNSRYGRARIVKIEREGNKYEVELSNGRELTFNSKGRCVREH